jgi:3-hydroxyacyl-CoA dehydrogenase
MEKIAIIGSGFVGRSWSILFARAGHPVSLFDTAAATADGALAIIDDSLKGLHTHGLVDDPGAVRGRIDIADSLADAVDGAVHVQESVNEKLEVKQAAFRDIDALAGPGTAIASSSSTMPVSVYSGDLPGRHRCLLAHPLNPPHLVPLVELCPAPWTDAKVVERTRDLMASIGQVPITMKKEMPGFIVNRLQVALLNEAFALLEDDCISAQDLDKAITDGLGLRWSVVGPFETIDLNASGGLAHYVDIFADQYHAMIRDRGAPRRWSEEIVARADAAMRARWPLSEIPGRQAARDRNLTRLAALRRDTTG